LVWVHYEPTTNKILDFYTYFHGRILSSPSSIEDAHRHGERPIVNVQSGKHGSLPYGWEDLQIQAEYRKRIPRHAASRSSIPWRFPGRKRFEGTWTDFVKFDKEVEIRGRAMRSIIQTDPTFPVLFDLEDWIQLPGILATLRRAYPMAALSSGIQNWTPELLAEARAVGLTTFVNVLGVDDTSENLRRAVSMRFDYIQTDHQSQLNDIIAGSSNRD
jgi:hypothetical protein